MESVYHWYMCILLYVKLLWSSSVTLTSMVNWRRGWGQSALWVYVHSAISETYMQCSGGP